MPASTLLAFSRSRSLQVLDDLLQLEVGVGSLGIRQALLGDALAYFGQCLHRHLPLHDLHGITGSQIRIQCSD